MVQISAGGQSPAGEDPFCHEPAAARHLSEHDAQRKRKCDHQRTGLCVCHEDRKPPVEWREARRQGA